MWTNAQCDGRPAKCRWRPLFNAAVCLTPTTRVACSNAAKTQNLLKLAGVPKLANRYQPLVGQSSPYCGDVEEILLFYNFFPIVNTWLSCEDMARQSCAMVCRGEFLAIFCILHFQRATCSMLQTCILNSHEGHTMCGSMVDMQSATAENRRGKKKIELVGRSSPYYGDIGRRYCCLTSFFPDCRYMP